MADCRQCGRKLSFFDPGQGGYCLHCAQGISTQDMLESYADARADARDSIRETQTELDALMVTTETTVGPVKRRLGIVTGQCALGMNIFRDFTAEIRDVVGGRSGAYQKAIKEAKDLCIIDMKLEALELGADAVIAANLDFNDITGGGGLFGGKGMIMVVATGTAVILREDDQDKNEFIEKRTGDL